MAATGPHPFSPGNQVGSRSEILDGLAATLSKLGLAKLELARAIETRDVTRYESAQSEIERLRLDCSNARIKLLSEPRAKRPEQ